MSDKGKPTDGTGAGPVTLREVRWAGEPVKAVVSTVRDDRPPRVTIGKVIGTVAESVTPGQDGTGEGGRPAPIGTTLKTLHDDIAALKSEGAQLKSALAALTAAVGKGGTGEGGRPAPVGTTLKTLHDDIGTLKSAQAALTAAVQSLNNHHHTYMGGVDYWNTSIHGHPAWDVETKAVSVITASMSFSNNWETSAPKFPGT